MTHCDTSSKTKVLALLKCLPTCRSPLSMASHPARGAVAAPVLKRSTVHSDTSPLCLTASLRTQRGLTWGKTPHTDVHQEPTRVEEYQICCSSFARHPFSNKLPQISHRPKLWHTTNNSFLYSTCRKKPWNYQTQKKPSKIISMWPIVLLIWETRRGLSTTMWYQTDSQAE